MHRYTITTHMLILSQEPIPFNFGDLWRFTLVVGLTAPPNYLWQVLLERTFPGRPAPTDYEEIREVYVVEDGGVPGEGTVIQERRPLSWKNTFLKWFLDCITFGALWNCILFLTLMGLVKHKSLVGIADAIRTVSHPRKNENVQGYNFCRKRYPSSLLATECGRSRQW